MRVGNAPSQLRTLERDVSSPTSRRAPEGARWALIVGISTYRASQLNLEYAHRDAEELYDFLRNASGYDYPEKNLHILTNERATTAALQRALRSFLTKPARNDLVILFFACHGASDPRRPDVTYLLTHDTDPNDIAGTALPMREIDACLAETLHARRVVIFADACHSAALDRPGLRGGSQQSLVAARLSRLARSKSVAFLASAEQNESAREGPQWGGGHGVFTHYLLEGLRGSADGFGQDERDGDVTIGELFEYVRDNVTQATNWHQHPAIGTKAFTRDLPLARVLVKEVVDSAEEDPKGVSGLPPPSRKQDEWQRRLVMRRWISRAYACVGVVATLASGLPIFFLHHDDPLFWMEYARTYPALFLFVFPFLPLTLWALRLPTLDALELITQSPAVTRGARAFFSMLLLLPIAAACGAAGAECSLPYAAPWEVIADTAMLRTIVPNVPAALKDAPRSPEPIWRRESQWPAAFFFLKDSTPSALQDIGMQGAERTKFDSDRESLRSTIATLLRSERIDRGEVKASRAGRARYAAVAAFGLVFGLLAFNSITLFAQRGWRRGFRSPVSTFRCLVAALVCIDAWLLMRTVTTDMERAIFGDSWVFERGSPAISACVVCVLLTSVGSHLGEKGSGAFILAWSTPLVALACLLAPTAVVMPLWDPKYLLFVALLITVAVTCLVLVKTD